MKEELAVATKDINGTIEKIINESLNNEASNSIMQLSASSNSVRLQIDCNKKVTYDMREEAKYSGDMTCGGCTFFVNKKRENTFGV